MDPDSGSCHGMSLVICGGGFVVNNGSVESWFSKHKRNTIKQKIVKAVLNQDSTVHTKIMNKIEHLL